MPKALPAVSGEMVPKQDERICVKAGFLVSNRESKK